MNISVEKTLAEQGILTAEQVAAAFAEIRDRFNSQIGRPADAHGNAMLRKVWRPHSNQGELACQSVCFS